MNKLLLIAFLFMVKIGMAQTEVKLNGNTYEPVKKEGSAGGGSQSINTGKTFEGLPVMQSKNGLLYVERVSKKTGKKYKKYITVK